MWQEAIKRFINHIDQESLGSYCSYQKINHEIVLWIDPFPTVFRNQVMADGSTKLKPSIRNPKKTRQELEEEEDEMYAQIDEMEWQQ
uniref:Uncharacterized protein n=1 Tax=Romanomermis culicivorax TaxID=13658 RepID=A0A915JXI8_ROMCU